MAVTKRRYCLLVNTSCTGFEHVATFENDALLKKLLHTEKTYLQQMPACSTHLTEDQVRGLFCRVLQNRSRMNVDYMVFRQRSILPGISTQGHMKK